MKHEKNAVIGIIGSLRGSYNRFLEEELAKHGMEGLLSPHGSILSCLYRNDGNMQVVEIARRLGRSKSSISELVDRLSDLGYVEKTRDSMDRRGVKVSLTRKGKSKKKHFDAISKNLIDTAYRGFTENEKETLVAALIKMKMNFSDSRQGET